MTNIRGQGNFPDFYDSLERNNKYNIFESLMGPSLELLFSICNRKFDLYTVINIGIDVIKNLEILHYCGIIHRDLKPNNLSFGCINLNYKKFKTEIGILDFGSSVSLIRQKNWISDKKRKNFIYGKKYMLPIMF